MLPELLYLVLISISSVSGGHTAFKRTAFQVASSVKFAVVRTDGETPDGLTALHCAAMAGSSSCARLLLDAGADSSLTTHDGR